jgi:hypothetical protein
MPPIEDQAVPFAMIVSDGAQLPVSRSFGAGAKIGAVCARIASNIGERGVVSTSELNAIGARSYLGRMCTKGHLMRVSGGLNRAAPTTRLRLALRPEAASRPPRRAPRGET